MRTLLCLTGQHRHLANDVLTLFEIEADYCLDVMRDDQDLSNLTSRVLSALPPILHKEQPDVVVVQGDTITCFASAVAAFLEKIPVCHIEAGLRTYDLSAPFPEEALRQMVTRIASLHCAATAANRETLLSEGVSQENIVVTGNTVIDALFWARNIMRDQNRHASMSFLPGELAKIEAYDRIVLVTGHRREHFGNKLASICQALAGCARKHQDVLFVYPVHPNPNVLQPVRDMLGSRENVMLLEPLNYPEFIYLMDRCYLVVTDSGGVQEEAPALGKPVVVTRDKTERAEAVATGQVIVAGTSKESIISAVDQLLCSAVQYSQMVQPASPYGDGKAAERIINSLRRFAGAGPPAS